MFHHWPGSEKKERAERKGESKREVKGVEPDLTCLRQRFIITRHAEKNVLIKYMIVLESTELHVHNLLHILEPYA